MATNDDNGQDDVAGRPAYEGMFDPLIAHHARVLDPTKATRIGDELFDSTIYVADRVLVRGMPDDAQQQSFVDWCKEKGYTVSPTREHRALAGQALAVLCGVAILLYAAVWHARTRLAPTRPAA